MEGLFITLEGPEGCGKTTQALKLKSYFEEQGREVILTKEPGDTLVGKEIRKLLLYPPEGANLSGFTEAYLYAADRAQHFYEVILPALNLGKVVICDRYIDSNIAYQHYGRGESLELIQMLNKPFTDMIQPDVTFLLLIDPAEGLKRKFMQEEVSRFEKEHLGFHKKVYDGYIELSKQNRRFIPIDASQNPDAVFSDIKTLFEQQL